METKEHVFFGLLLLSTYLPIAAYTSIGMLARESGARHLLLTVAAVDCIVGIVMEGGGGSGGARLVRHAKGGRRSPFFSSSRASRQGSKAEDPANEREEKAIKTLRAV